MKPYLALPVVLSLSALLTACNAMRDMSEMKDTTKHMDQITTHMDDTTTQMSAKTDHLDQSTNAMRSETHHMGEDTDQMLRETRDMKSETHDLHLLTQGMYDLTGHLDRITSEMNSKEHNIYVDNRQANSKLIRRYALQDMNETPSILDKIADAAVYVDSFEFQVWKGDDTDTLEKRQSLMANAAEEFFRAVRRFLTNPDDYSPLSFANSTKGLLALAAAMGEINPNQADLAKEKNFSPVSVLSIVESGLRFRADVNMDRNKDQVPSFAIEVLRNEPQAVYLLNLRHNFLVGCVLATMAGVDVDNVTTKDQALNLWKKLKEMVKEKGIEVQNQNVAQLDEYILYLNEAIRVRRELIGMQYPIERSFVVRAGTRLIRAVAKVDKLSGAAPEEKAAKLKRVAVINSLLSRLDKLVTPNEKSHWDFIDDVESERRDLAHAAAAAR